MVFHSNNDNEDLLFGSLQRRPMLPRPQNQQPPTFAAVLPGEIAANHSGAHSLTLPPQQSHMLAFAGGPRNPIGSFNNNAFAIGLPQQQLALSSCINNSNALFGYDPLRSIVQHGATAYNSALMQQHNNAMLQARLVAAIQMGGSSQAVHPSHFTSQHQKPEPDLVDPPTSLQPLYQNSDPQPEKSIKKNSMVESHRFASTHAETGNVAMQGQGQLQANGPPHQGQSTNKKRSSSGNPCDPAPPSKKPRSPQGKSIPKSLNQRWHDTYQELILHYEQHETLEVPRSVNAKLSHWVDTQRAAFRGGYLKPERKAKLDDIGFVWDTLTDQDQKWNVMFEKLKAFKEEYGDVLIPANDSKHQELRLWVEKMQRSLGYANKHKDRLSRMDSLGFSWWSTAREYALRVDETDWPIHYDRLKVYYKNHGHTNVEKGHMLYKWVKKQLHSYRNEELSQERIEALNQVNFEWAYNRRESKNQRTWEEMFQKLKKYKEANGNFKVPLSYPKEPGLHSWVKKNRHALRYGSLPSRRLQALSQIGFE